MWLPYSHAFSAPPVASYAPAFHYPSAIYPQGQGFAINGPTAPTERQASLSDNKGANVPLGNSGNGPNQEQPKDSWGQTIEPNTNSGQANDNKEDGVGDGWDHEANTASGDAHNNTNNNANNDENGWGDGNNAGIDSNNNANADWDTDENNANRDTANGQQDNEDWAKGNDNTQSNHEVWGSNANDNQDGANASTQANANGGWDNGNAPAVDQIRPATATAALNGPRPLYGPHGAYYDLITTTDEVPADAEEEPRYDVPETVVEEKGVSKQVQPGKGYLYNKKRCAPRYLDTLEQPYARFVFKYRTKGITRVIFEVHLLTAVSRRSREASQRSARDRALSQQ